jgi:hypothetical protein
VRSGRYRRLRLLLSCRLVSLRRNGNHRLELQKRLLTDAFDVHQLFDLFAEDSQLNVYAGEIEVRPPAAPTTEPAERAGSAISTLTSCQRCVTL